MTTAHKTFKENFIYLSSAIGILILLSLTTINVYKIFNPKAPEVKTVLAKTADINDERQFWINFLSSNPEYVPGILELTRIEKNLGNNDNAQKLFLKAKAINPNDDKVKETEELFR
jgi:hypothetical protein